MKGEHLQLGVFSFLIYCDLEPFWWYF